MVTACPLLCLRKMAWGQLVPAAAGVLCSPRFAASTRPGAPPHSHTQILWPDSPQAGNSKTAHQPLQTCLSTSFRPAARALCPGSGSQAHTAAHPPATCGLACLGSCRAEVSTVSQAAHNRACELAGRANLQFTWNRVAIGNSSSCCASLAPSTPRQRPPRNG